MADADGSAVAPVSCARSHHLTLPPRQLLLHVSSLMILLGPSAAAAEVVGRSHRAHLGVGICPLHPPRVRGYLSLRGGGGTHTRSERGGVRKVKAERRGVETRKPKRTGAKDIPGENDLGVNSGGQKDRKDRGVKTGKHLIPDRHIDKDGDEKYFGSADQNCIHDPDLPVADSILIPRPISIPRLLRLLSVFALTSSLCQCLITSGEPYESAVRSLLGVDNRAKLTLFHHFFAKKTAQAQNEMLPHKHLPGTAALLGVLGSLMLSVGITVLLPRWFVRIDSFMRYRAYPILATNLPPVTVPITGGGRESNDASLDTMQLLKKTFAFDRDAEATSETGEDASFNQNPLFNTHLKGTAAVLLRLPESERRVSRGRRVHAIQNLNRFVEHCDGETAGLTNQVERYYFEHNQRRVYLDLASRQHHCIDGGPTLHKMPICSLLERGKRGLGNGDELERAEARYGKYNKFELSQPTVRSTFAARISSPLAVLQLLGKILAMLEDSVLSSLLDMGMTLGNHYVASKRSIVAAAELASEVQSNANDAGKLNVLVLRRKPLAGKKKRMTRSAPKDGWIQFPASELLPGDVFRLTFDRSSGDITMPVDALILEGGCIADEAVLTGECIPQAKRPVEESDANAKLDFDGTNRNSILFAGTKVLHSTKQTIEEVEEFSVKCLALRTGTYSSRGELMRALTKSASQYGTISNQNIESDALKLIAALSIFAFFSCLSLVVSFGGAKEKVTVTARTASPFRRIIQCTRILIASIPSDIPLAISAIASSCIENLRKEADVVCTDPGSLLTSAHVDVAVFDKTGTLTAETQSLSRVIAPSHLPSGHQHPMLETILSGCHSIDMLEESNGENRLIGDPVDLACFQHSKWSFEGHESNSAQRMKVNPSHASDYPVRLWQLKSFPFDATRRCSSALVLTLSSRGHFNLMKLVKGAPETMQTKFEPDATVHQWYEDQMSRLSSKGSRIITLAVAHVSDKDELLLGLFPDGLPARIEDTDKNDIDRAVAATISEARTLADQKVHRSSVESGDSFDFIGLACFDASLRPSTSRILSQLRNSGIYSCMLTGDNIDAAVAVAKDAGLIKRSAKRLAVLDIVNDLNKGPTLIWKVSKWRNTKGRKDCRRVQIRMFSYENNMNIFSQVDNSLMAVAASGDAIDLLLKKVSDPGAANLVLDRLHEVSVVARASPATKERVVSCLRSRHKVFMCGDGVNDVSAMRAADVSAALLNGYGGEGETSTSDDPEDQRRLQRILTERKFQQRRNSVVDGTDPSAIRKKRLEAKLNSALAAFKEGQSDAPFRGLLKSIGEALRSEREMQKALKRGGGEAARIIAEEEKLRNTILGKSENDVLLHPCIENSPELEAGEACLAATFTFLRPCIDGADAILRVGIAAAACSLTIYRNIALNSLMACFNLSTLYKDGFRYGKYMWNAESMFLTAIGNASYESSCRPRPKIASVRPDKSIFTKASTVSTMGQAVIHLLCLRTGARMGQKLESSARNKKCGFRIKWIEASSIFGDTQPGSLQSAVHNKENTGLLGRPKFTPNLVTNAVFLLSIFQNAIISLVNHSGAPFYGGIIESKKLCLSIAASMLFPIVCVSQSIPSLNTLLQLAPMPSKSSQRKMLALFALDGFGCYAIEKCSALISANRLQLSRSQHGLTRERKGQKSGAAASMLTKKTAAEVEELLLSKDAQENSSLLLGLFMVGLVLVGKIVA